MTRVNELFLMLVAKKNKNKNLAKMMGQREKGSHDIMESITLSFLKGLLVTRAY